LSYHDGTNQYPHFWNVDVSLDENGFTISKKGKLVAEYGVRVIFQSDGKYDIRLIQTK
jgi:hypothetical protein